MASEWRVLIADDEPMARRGVRQLLAGFPQFSVVGECRNGAEVLASLETIGPDVLFLDVQMPGLGGFDVIAKRTPERMPAVVFLTAYEEFALRAFEAQALDYLVKPVGERRFAATMKRLMRTLGARQTGPPGARIAVATGRGTVLLALSDIDWIEAADNYARLWIGNRHYLVRQSLSHLEARARVHGFVRVHRGALVALAAVRELRSTSEKDLVIVLRTGTTIPVSRRRRGTIAGIIRDQSM
jgi:two-component system, LytTR family, response regulator